MKGPIKNGKVRDIYELAGGDQLAIVTTDRISAFDVVLPTEIPDRGVVLTRLSLFWLGWFRGKSETSFIPSHVDMEHTNRLPADFASRKFYGRTMIVDKLDMIPLECIVRGYLTGSGWTSYQKNQMICGIKLPLGIHESEGIEPIFTPSTKAETGHDENISYEQSVEVLRKKYGNRAEEIAQTVKNYSLALYKEAARYAYEKGVIIADTKFEFGLDKHGDVTLADEVLTPDSSRFWSLASYEIGKSQKSFDKQIVRDWLKNESGWDLKTLPAPELPKEVVDMTQNKYIDVYERLTDEQWI